MVGHLFAGAGDFLYDTFFINGQPERLPDAHVVKWFFGHVETDEVGRKIWVSMKIRPLQEHVQQFNRHKVLIPYNIRRAGVVQVQSGGRVTNWQKVNEV